MSEGHKKRAPGARIREWLEAQDDGYLLFGNTTEFDDAIIGIGHRCGQPPVVLYDRVKLALCLVQQGLDYDEAFEHISFNMEGAWVGERTPLIVDVPWRD